MSLLRFFTTMFATLCGVSAAAQSYPSKPIRIITATPGGGADFTARLIAQGLTGGSLGQPIVVDNRGGASGVIAITSAAKSAPDGYTVLLYSNAMWTLPFLQEVSYDPIKEFAPLTSAVIAPNVLVVHPSLPVKSVKELIALAKNHPGELNYASSGTGSANHLAGEMFNYMAHINIMRIQYKGTGPAYNALIGGQVQLGFGTATAVTPHMKSGKLRALAVTSAEPSSLLPGLPTVAAAGLPGYDAVSTYGLFLPIGTQPAIINRLNQEIVRVLNRTEFKEKFANFGAEVVGNSPSQFAATIKSEMDKMGKVIQEAGIRAE